MTGLNIALIFVSSIGDKPTDVNQTKMDIRKTANKLIRAGYNIGVYYEKPNQFCSRDWALYDYRAEGNARPKGLVAFGRDNVEAWLSKMAKAANIELL